MMMPDDVTAGQAVSQNCGSAHQECLQTCYVQAVLGVYRATLSLNMVRHGKHRMDKTRLQNVGKAFATTRREDALTMRNAYTNNSNEMLMLLKQYKAVISHPTDNMRT